MNQSTEELSLSSEALVNQRLIESSKLESGSSETKNRIRAIDGLRALAMFMVFTYHAWEFADTPKLPVNLLGLRFNLRYLFNSLPAGVDLFMVLSGFCLFWPLCNSQKRLTAWTVSDYFKRRIRRIAPPYYMAILYVTLLPNLLVCLYRVLGRPGKWQAFPPAWQYITHLFFIHTLFRDTYNGIQAAFWSLGLEMQFYIVFPLIIFSYRKYGIKVAGAVTLVSLLYRLIVGALTVHADYTTRFLLSIFFLGRWMQFAAGMTAAWLVARSLAAGKTYSPVGGTGLFVAALGLYAIAVTPLIQRVAIFPVRDLMLAVSFSIAMVALCATKTPVCSLFENRLVTWLGFVSYSIFLIHQKTIYFVGETVRKFHPMSGPARFLLMETVGFILIVGVATVFFRLFEEPFIGAPKRKPAPMPKALPERLDLPQ